MKKEKDSEKKAQMGLFANTLANWEERLIKKGEIRIIGLVARWAELLVREEK